jgi:hypothetical protein
MTAEYSNRKNRLIGRSGDPVIGRPQATDKQISRANIPVGKIRDRMDWTGDYQPNEERRTKPGILAYVQLAGVI